MACSISPKCRPRRNFGVLELHSKRKVTTSIKKLFVQAHVPRDSICSASFVLTIMLTVTQRTQRLVMPGVVLSAAFLLLSTEISHAEGVER